MNSNKVKRQALLDDATLNYVMILLAFIIALIIFTAVYLTACFITADKAPAPNNEINESVVDKDGDYPFKQEISVILPPDNPSSAIIPADSIDSDFALLINTKGEIVASRRSSTTIYPASMTKVMTLIVVYENLPSASCLDDVLTINIPRGEHSGYGFEMGEKLTVKDLIYAAILQSDGVACITLAKYIAGSEANFVKLMNDKVRELGLLEGDPENNPSTNFTNCSGLHEQYHYTTAYDMAVIMSYAMKNTFCAEVLTSISYRPSENFRPGEGCVFWHSFLHNRLNDGAIQPTTATIKGGKTGWTGSDSGYCIASYIEGKNGENYILVTAKAEGWASAAQDAVSICNNYIK